MKKMLFLLLVIFPVLINAQQDLKNTKWLLQENGLLTHMSEYSVILCTACADLTEIQTEGRTLLSFEDFLFVSTYHPGTQTENMLSSYHYEFIPEKNQLRIQFDFSRSNFYTYEITDGKLKLTLIQ